MDYNGLDAGDRAAAQLLTFFAASQTSSASKDIEEQAPNAKEITEYINAGNNDIIDFRNNREMLDVVEEDKSSDFRSPDADQDSVSKQIVRQQEVEADDHSSDTMEIETNANTKTKKVQSKKKNKNSSDAVADENPKPKRPMSAYNYFFQAERAKISGNVEETSRVIGQRWKELNGEKRQSFVELAKKDSKRYRDELREYQFRGAAGPNKIVVDLSDGSELWSFTDAMLTKQDKPKSPVRVSKWQQFHISTSSGARPENRSKNKEISSMYSKNNENDKPRLTEHGDRKAMDHDTNKNSLLKIEPNSRFFQLSSVRDHGIVHNESKNINVCSIYEKKLNEKKDGSTKKKSSDVSAIQDERSTSKKTKKETSDEGSKKKFKRSALSESIPKHSKPIPSSVYEKLMNQVKENVLFTGLAAQATQDCRSLARTEIQKFINMSAIQQMQSDYSSAMSAMSADTNFNARLDKFTGQNVPPNYDHYLEELLRVSALGGYQPQFLSEDHTLAPYFPFLMTQAQPGNHSA